MPLSYSLIVCLGALGILGISILWPVIAGMGYWLFSRRRSPLSVFPPVPSHIDILIPAHNEEHTLPSTLSSVTQSMQYFREHVSAFPIPHYQIYVGADSCTDNTIPVARQFPDVRIMEYPHHQSKWLTLKKLCEASQADWMILVDAGTVWPQDFLVVLLQRLLDTPNTLALCPAYQPYQAHWLHRLLWRVEAGLKQLEVLCGGPVSVHGATVCYKAGPLKRVFHYLGDTHWLNDDVAIPLTLRALYPEGTILYPVGHIQDEGIHRDPPGLQRRTRILTGNLQWVKSLLPDCFRQNPIAGTIALRRLFRILWAYWVVLCLLAVAMAFPKVGLLFGGLSLGLFLFKSTRDIGRAALVSLLTPLQLMSHTPSFHGVWK